MATAAEVQAALERELSADEAVLGMESPGPSTVRVWYEDGSSVDVTFQQRSGPDVEA